MRTLYSESHITRIQTNVPTNVAHGGGGIGTPGNTTSWMGHQGVGGNGKYVKWATPDISAKIPQMNRTPFGNTQMGNIDGGSDESNTTNLNRGFFGAGGNGYNNGAFLNRGGGGLGKFETQNFSSTMDGFTYSATGVNGTGAGGGSIRSNNNDTNSVFNGNSGGDGLVIIRMATGQYSNSDTRPTAGGSVDETAIGTYRYYIFDGAGTFKP